MAELPRRAEGLDLTTFEGCILESTTFVNRFLKPLLSAKQTGRKSPIYHSELMIVAMIATAFQVRFSTSDLSDNPNWRADRRKLKRQMLMHYLYDILHDDWRGSGDSKLHETVRTMRYLEQAPPSATRWGQVLDDWYASTQKEHVHSREARRHIRDSRPEYLLLKFIFSRRMESAKTYHVEHVIPVSILQSQMGESDEWPINTIGNLALLDQAGALRNNVQTYDVMLHDQRRRGEITAEEQTQQQINYEKRLICPVSLLPSPLTKRSFERFLEERFELLKREFIRVWRDYIPQDPPA